MDTFLSELKIQIRRLYLFFVKEIKKRDVEDIIKRIKEH